MKKSMIYSFLMLCGMAMTSCSTDNYNEPAQYEPNATITPSLQTINAPADGNVYTIDVATTAGEWNAYTNDAWINVSTKNTNTSSGTIYVSVPENGVSRVREGSVVIMSGSARQSIPVKQEAADNPYNAPEGYDLVWNDEFDSGSELNANDWTHEVQGSGWVNNELQNYVNHVSPDGNPVTEIKGGTLRINCFKENGKVYSGRVYAHVKEGWKYGYIEASIKLPKGKGTWPAFWMMPVNFTGWPDSGEIDIMEEVGTNANFVSSSLHANAHVHTNNTQVTHEMYCPGAEGEFHTYAYRKI